MSHHQDPQFLSVLDKAAFDWLSLQNDWQIELVSFSDAGKLKEFDGACWYYSESSELPAAAVDAAEKVRDYVKSGGKLLLALIAAKYVDTLGIDNAPDAVEWKEESFFYWNGYVALEPHPVFENLPRGFFVADNAVLKPFVNARWLESPPKNGRVLGIANWGARFVEDERVIVEWDLGAGQVIAFGMHNFRFDTEPSENFVTLVRNAFNYISAPFVAKLSIVSDNPAVPKGAGYLGSHYKDSVVISEGSSIRAAITGKAWKALDITLTARTPAGGVVSTTSFIPGQQFTVELPLGTNDLSPGEYVAGVDIAQGDETLTSLSREFFIVPETAQSGPADRHWMWELRTPNLVAEIDKGTGTVWGLYDSSSNTKVQFAGNPDNLPAVATPDHRWLGDLVLKYRFNGDITWRSMTTANSSEIRRVLGQEDSVVVVYDPGPPEQLGATEPMISERFTVEGDSLNWKIRIKNRSQAGMVLGELAMPLALNTCFAGETDMSEIYERRVMLHSFIGGASSWILAAPLAGIPPYLLIWAKEGTKLEAIAHVDEYGQRPDGWEGLINVFPYSKASRETRNWYEWYNNHSQAVILPGEELVLNFGIKFIQDYKEINETLFADGKVAVDVAPAMVLPTDMTGHLRVSSKKQFSVTGDDYTTIEKVSSDGTSSVYRFKFGRTGQHNLTITDVDGEVTNLHFLAIEPIEKLAKAHAIHIARDQQYRDPKSFRDGQFFMYDAEEERMVMKPRHGHMSGGSDECGLAEPLSLVWKNVVDPNPDEIETMEYYIERFLYGKVQQKETYAVSTGVGDSYDDEQAYNRSFNYPHVVNIYFAMSKIAEYYGLTRFRDSDGYLL
ncbi:MAG TPA: DUF5695 domain-containing protein, partial [Armatimonadota bacterium]|nr:DUF5695 domain-containing protein [Armatimonadota bacterium]